RAPEVSLTARKSYCLGGPPTIVEPSSRTPPPHACVPPPSICAWIFVPTTCCATCPSTTSRSWIFRAAVPDGASPTSSRSSRPLRRSRGGRRSTIVTGPHHESHNDQ